MMNPGTKPEQRIQVRMGTRDDATFLAAGNIAMAWETERLALDQERVHLGVANLLASPTDGFYLVAEDDTGRVGQCMVTEEWSDWRNGRFWWIQSVYVLPAFRRRGVFRRLFDELNRMAQECGDVCGLRLYVERENRTAAAVYDALGLRESVYVVREADFVLSRTSA